MPVMNPELDSPGRVLLLLTPFVLPFAVFQAVNFLSFKLLLLSVGTMQRYFSLFSRLARDFLFQE